MYYPWLAGHRKLSYDLANYIPKILKQVWLQSRQVYTRRPYILFLQNKQLMVWRALVKWLHVKYFQKIFNTIEFYNLRRETKTKAQTHTHTHTDTAGIKFYKNTFCMFKGKKKQANRRNTKRLLNERQKMNNNKVKKNRKKKTKCKYTYK